MNLEPGRGLFVCREKFYTDLRHFAQLFMVDLPAKL